MKLNKIAKDLGVTNKRVLEMIRDGRLVIESYSIYENIQSKNVVIEKIMSANALKSRQAAEYHFKNGNYDPDSFIVKKNKPGPKPKPADNVQP